MRYRFTAHNTEALLATWILAGNVANNESAVVSEKKLISFGPVCFYSCLHWCQGTWQDNAHSFVSSLACSKCNPPAQFVDCSKQAAGILLLCVPQKGPDCWNVVQVPPLQPRSVCFTWGNFPPTALIHPISTIHHTHPVNRKYFVPVHLARTKEWFGLFQI